MSADAGSSGSGSGEGFVFEVLRERTGYMGDGDGDEPQKVGEFRDKEQANEAAKEELKQDGSFVAIESREKRGGLALVTGERPDATEEEVWVEEKEVFKEPQNS